MKTVLSGRDSLSRVQPRGAADDHEIHGTVSEEGIEVGIGDGAVGVAEAANLRGVRAIDRCDVYIGKSAGGASVGFRYVATAGEADMDGHASGLTKSKQRCHYDEISCPTLLRAIVSSPGLWLSVTQQSRAGVCRVRVASKYKDASC